MGCKNMQEGSSSFKNSAECGDSIKCGVGENHGARSAGAYSGGCAADCTAFCGCSADNIGAGLLRGVKKIHIVGVGGISMSAIAKILVYRGYSCTGSDTSYNDNCADVEALGVKVFRGHSASNISDQEVLIYTAAVTEDIPEIVRAKELGIRVVSRAEFLGALMREYPLSIAVSGAHGKTTTTSMVAHILADICDPTVLVGGLLRDNHSNVMIGVSDVFVHEACEFKDTFLQLQPAYGVVLNLDEDHLDYFSGMDAIVRSFRKFASGCSCAVVYNADDDNAASAVRGFGGRLVSVGLQVGADAQVSYTVSRLERTHDAKARFDIARGGEHLAHVELGAAGFINWANAAAAFAVCFEMLSDHPELCAGLHSAGQHSDSERHSAGQHSAFAQHNALADYIRERLETFGHADRRFQIYGTHRGITVVDDFAHHPNEIRHALNTARAVSGGRVVAFFQPYTYSRTKELLAEFGECFNEADIVVVSDILGGREADPGDIHSRDLVDLLLKRGESAYYADTLENASELAMSLAGDGDMIITLGCGNVYLAARYMDNRLKSGE